MTHQCESTTKSGFRACKAPAVSCSCLERLCPDHAEAAKWERCANGDCRAWLCPYCIGHCELCEAPMCTACLADINGKAVHRGDCARQEFDNAVEDGADRLREELEEVLA